MRVPNRIERQYHLVRHMIYAAYDTDSSLLAPRYPPNPMEMAPAVSSAKPAKITTRVLPSVESPAVRAKGTVNPSERPMMASLITLALMLDFSISGSASNSVLASVDARDSRSVDLRTSVSRPRSTARLLLMAFGPPENRLETHDVPERSEAEATCFSFAAASSG